MNHTFVANSFSSRGSLQWYRVSQAAKQLAEEARKSARMAASGDVSPSSASPPESPTKGSGKGPKGGVPPGPPPAASAGKGKSLCFFELRIRMDFLLILLQVVFFCSNYF